MSDPESDLETLRNEVAEIDREIALAIGKRLALARKIGERKAVNREPTRDFDVEALVLDRWRGGLTPLGVVPGRAEALARWLVEESVRVQQEARASTPGLETESADIAIVGGAGAMGRWLTQFFEDAGHRVAVVDPNAAATGRPTITDVETAARQVDVLVFATPIRSTAPLLRRALATDTRALVFDVLSVKAPVVKILQSAAAAGRRVSSIHPMFGPSARTLSGRNLLIVSCGVPEADRAARALFERSALSLAEVPLDRHDLLIAESLGLAHAVSLLFLAALSTDPASPLELAQAASTTFHRQSSLAGMVAAEGPELYLDIQALNPHSWGLYQELRAALDRLSDIVERRDLPAFTELLRSGTAKLEAPTGPMRT
jgi:chorismate mutase / prephenate dehydrogenase